MGGAGRWLRRQRENQRNGVIFKIEKTTFQHLLLTIGGGYLIWGGGKVFNTNSMAIITSTFDVDGEGGECGFCFITIFVQILVYFLCSAI